MTLSVKPEVSVGCLGVFLTSISSTPQFVKRNLQTIFDHLHFCQCRKAQTKEWRSSPCPKLLCILHLHFNKRKGKNQKPKHLVTMFSFLGLQKGRCQAVKPAFYLEGLLFRRPKAKIPSNGEVAQAPQTFRESHKKKKKASKHFLLHHSSARNKSAELPKTENGLGHRGSRTMQISGRSPYCFLEFCTDPKISVLGSFHFTFLGDLTDRLLQDNLA